MVTEAEIIQAIEKNEFTFFYQPKESLVTGKVTGAEALIRWIRSDGLMTMPDEFIPLAEQTQLIREITRHMFPKLISDLLVLHDVDDQLTVSFNASSKDFEDDTFAKMLLDRMNLARLPYNSLQIELTETVTLEGGEMIRSNILPLSEAGVCLAMDDFGMGYSSLDTLSKWPFKIIKLDKGIIGRMMDSDKSLTIVKSSVRMAHELDICVVAEGVETNAQYHHLLESGCSTVQGYWISQPLPMDQFIAFVEEDARWSGIPIGLIHMAIIDHVQWRKKLVSEVVKLAVLPKDSPNRKFQSMPPLSCLECRLGLWYHGAGQVFNERKSYQELEQPHCEFHKVGLRIVKMVADGASLEELNPQLRDLSEHSMSVLNKLQTLENEGLIDMQSTHQQWGTQSEQATS